MKLIVGLGNPGREYEGTRHNVGFWLLEKLRADLAGPGLIFLKPAGFINESGEDVARKARYLNLDLVDLVVVHDDMDIQPGEFRLQFGRSAAGHKGVESVIESLGSQAFWRLRVGTGRPPEGVDADDYVIGKFSSSEQEVVDSLYPQILATVQDWVLRK